ncbi:MAG: RNHCP domain-containing protein [Cyanobacteria bacterium P01_H01_bin.15]
MTSKKFQRCREDFVCENCGEFVQGTGYTNHCTRCLWSKHVDINPGDRASLCGGRMRPVAVETKKDSYIILHRCVICGFERRNKVSSNDNFETLLQIVANRGDEDSDG